MSDVETPELDKQLEIVKSGKARTVQDFIDWVRDDKGWVFARYVEDDEREPGDGIYGEQPIQVWIQAEDLMAEYFDIDLKKVEQERRALLEALREASKT